MNTPKPCPVCNMQIGANDLDPTEHTLWQLHLQTCQLATLIRIAEALEATATEPPATRNPIGGPHP